MHQAKFLIKMDREYPFADPKVAQEFLTNIATKLASYIQGQSSFSEWTLTVVAGESMSLQLPPPMINVSGIWRPSWAGEPTKVTP